MLRLIRQQMLFEALAFGVVRLKRAPRPALASVPVPKPIWAKVLPNRVCASWNFLRGRISIHYGACELIIPEIHQRVQQSSHVQLPLSGTDTRAFIYKFGSCKTTH